MLQLPEVVPIHMAHPEFYTIDLLANTNYTMCCGLPQAGSGTLDPILINLSMILTNKNHSYITRHDLAPSFLQGSLCPFLVLELHLKGKLSSKNKSWTSLTGCFGLKNQKCNNKPLFLYQKLCIKAKKSKIYFPLINTQKHNVQC